MAKSKNKTAVRKRKAPTQSHFRSAITNGSALLIGVDERTAWCRRLRDLIHAHTADLGGDGCLSEAERVLVRRAAVLTVQLEFIEVTWANKGGQAGPKSLAGYQRTVNTLRRLLETLGLRRRAKDITPHPLDYARRYDELEETQP